MRKVISHIKFALLATTLITSCRTQEWDPAEDLKDLTYNWSCRYVDDALSYAVDSLYTLNRYSDKQTVLSSVLKDTLSIDFAYRYSRNGDSVNVSSGLLQIKDSIFVTTDGYIYADKFWAHLFTADSGIINYKGVFHVDFYETGQTVPWAWSEIWYNKSDEEKTYYSYTKYYKKSETHKVWY
jgi:hypothetical protein